jgi:uncharacterized protein (TIGR03067 family)
MRPLPLALVAFLAVAPAFAEDKAPEGDLAQLRGTWKSLSKPGDRTIILEIKGRGVSLVFATPQGESHSAKAELKLDETATPKAMDWLRVVRDGQDAPDVVAIYELRGDTLTIRAARRAPDVAQVVRPTEFRPDQEAGADDQVVFLRQKVEATKDAT